MCVRRGDVQHAPADFLRDHVLGRELPEMKPERRFVSSIASHSSSVTCSAVWDSRRGGEAECTNSDNLPSSETACSKDVFAASRRVRSATIAGAFSSLATE